jgi:LysM repeat protein
MTERGLPSVDGAPACPFVAFEDDRESRSTSPDHRHRCYAEPLPAPRAAAHQEAYCLSSAFPVCPTFQDWARREAAHARGEGERPAPAPSATARPRASVAAGDLGASGLAASQRDGEEGELGAWDRDAEGPADPPPATTSDPQATPPPYDEPPIRRNPPRDWAAPPPWASGGTGSPASAGTRRSGETGGAGDGRPPEFLAGRSDEGRGLAGSAADRLASGGAASAALAPSALHSTPASSGPAAAPDAELADLVSPERSGERPIHGYQPPARPGNRPRVSSTRSAPPRDAIVGPAWERSRRYEAYPSIRTRVGMPQLPRLAVLAVALAIAAVALFFLPALLGVGGGGVGDTGSASPSASQAAQSSSPVPSVSAAPTQQVYVVKAGDTMGKIARRFGLTQDQLCNANKEAIPNCDKIAIGDEIVIPTTAPDVINDASAAPSAS